MFKVITIPLQPGEIEDVIALMNINGYELAFVNNNFMFFKSKKAKKNESDKS